MTRRVWAFVGVAWIAAAALAGESATRPASAPATGETAYPVTELKVRYLRENPWVPAVAELMDTEVTLGLENGGWVAPREGGKGVTMKLREVGKGEIQKIHPSAIRVIYEGILKALNDRGIIGVFVTVDPADIAGENDIDVRVGRRDLNFIVTVSRVKEVRTVRQDAAPEGGRVNNPRDAYVLQGSPVKAVDDRGGGGPNIINQKALDGYVARLNAEPGLHVEVDITGTEKPGEVVLEYLVTRGGPASGPGTNSGRGGP